MTNLREVSLEIKSLKLDDKLVSEMRYGFTPDLSGAEWLPYTFSKQKVKLSGADGIKTIYAQLRDKAGNLSPVENASITLDTQPPENCSISINNGSKWTNDRQMRVMLNLGAEGAVKMQISNEENFDKASWENFAETKRWLLGPAGDGVKNVYVRFMDEARNISEVVQASIILDTQPPTNGSVVINNNDKYTRSKVVSVAISATDAVKALLVDQSGKSEIFDFQPNADQVMIKEWRLDSLQGVKTIRAYFMDAAQNKTTQPALDEIIYDATGPPPPLVVVNNGEAYTNNPHGLVNLKIMSRENPAALRTLISNTPDFSGVSPAPFIPAIENWQLPADEDGKKVVYVKLLDEAGNSSETVKAEIVLDRKAPEIENITLNEGKKWVSGNKTKLEMQVSGATKMQVASSESALKTAGWEPFREIVHPFQLSAGDGEKTLYFRFRDDAGNLTQVEKAVVHVDATPPTGSLIINSNQKFTNQESAVLDIRFDDAELMKLSRTPDFTGVEWQPVKTRVETWELRGEDGRKTVFLKLKDKAGNESEVIGAVIMLDRKPPSRCRVLINNGARWLNNPARRVTISLFAEGASEAMIANDQDFSKGRWAPVIPTVGWTLEPDDGVKDVFVKYRDEAGNESPVMKASIRLDTQPPVLKNLTIDGGRQFTNHKDLKVTVEMKTEGAHFVALSNEPVENPESPDWKPITDQIEWTLDEGEGAKTIFAALKDSAGNVSSTYTGNIIADRTPPSGCRIIINNNDKYTNHPEKKVSLLIAAGGATEMRLSNDASFNDAGWVPVSVRKSDWILPGEDGVKVVFAEFRDEAGNVSEIVSDQIHLDRKPPGGPKVVINQDSLYTVRRDKIVNLALSASEAKKMIIAQNPQFEGAQWEEFQSKKQVELAGEEGEKEIFVKFMDEAGNETRPVSDKIMLDYTPPQVLEFTIEGGKEWTNHPQGRVSLFFSVEGATEMMISEEPDFGSVSWQPYQAELAGFKLSEEDGEKKIYVKFRDDAGNVSDVSSAVINLKRTF